MPVLIKRHILNGSYALRNILKIEFKKNARPTIFIIYRHHQKFNFEYFHSSQEERKFVTKKKIFDYFRVREIMAKIDSKI